MRSHALAIAGFFCAAAAIPAPTPTATTFSRNPSNEIAAEFVQEQLRKRQSVPDLLALASQAGIPLPTNPAALLNLYPVITELIQYLPTAPVLSVLETAVPSGFLSEVVHNPSYASDLEQAFATGGGPGWFSSLPTDVRSYLHTYQVAALVNEVGSAETEVASALTETSIDLSSLPHSIIGQTTGTGSVEFGPLMSGFSTEPTLSGGAVTSMTGSETTAAASQTMATSAGTGGTTSAAQASSGTSSGATPASASSSAAGAAQETGMLAAGAIAAAGVVALVGLW